MGLKRPAPWHYMNVISIESPQFCFAHTQTQCSTCYQGRQWSRRRGAWKLVSRQLLVVLLFRFGKINFTWSQEQWEPAPWHGFTSWPGQRSLLGGQTVRNLDGQRNISLHDFHLERDLLCGTSRNRKRRDHKNIPRHLQNMTQKQTKRISLWFFLALIRCSDRWLAL